MKDAGQEYFNFDAQPKTQDKRVDVGEYSGLVEENPVDIGLFETYLKLLIKAENNEDHDRVLTGSINHLLNKYYDYFPLVSDNERSDLEKVKDIAIRRAFFVLDESLSILQEQFKNMRFGNSSEQDKEEVKHISPFFVKARDALNMCLKLREGNVLSDDEIEIYDQRTLLLRNLESEIT